MSGLLAQAWGFAYIRQYPTTCRRMRLGPGENPVNASGSADFRPSDITFQNYS